MKNPILAGVIVAMALSSTVHAASFETIASDVDASAFQDADDGWRKVMVRRNAECGAYGKNDTRRIDVLISRYETLASALNAGDENAAREAAKKFSATATSNSRYEACWRAISRKVGVSPITTGQN